MKKLIIISFIVIMGCNNDRNKMENLIKKRDNLKKSLDSVDLLILNEKNKINNESLNQKNETFNDLRISDSIRFKKERENYHKFMPSKSFYDSAYNETLKQIKDLELLMGK